MVSRRPGRWGCALGADPGQVRHRDARARARPHPIVVGHRVDLVGDLSGSTTPSPASCGATSAVRRCCAPSTTATPRSAWSWPTPSSSPLVVTAVADPEAAHRLRRPLPRSPPTRAGSTPVLCLTKSDLADPYPFAAYYRDLEFPGAAHPSRDQPADELAAAARGPRLGAGRGLRRRQVHAGQPAAAGPRSSAPAPASPASGRAGTPPSRPLALPIDGPAAG